MKKILCLIVAAVCLQGCFSRTVYVPDGQAVRLRQTIKKAKIWVKTDDGDTVEGTMDLPEGWYCLSDTTEE